jgi:ketosteroid isomerase-like protein
VSQENARAVRALVEYWNAGGRRVPAEFLDPEVVLETPFSSVSGESYRGYAGIAQWLRELDEQFIGWQNQIDDVREVGDSVIAVGVLHMRGRVSDIELHQPAGWVGSFNSDHRITRARVYLDRAEAFKAVGLEAPRGGAQDAPGV